MTNKFFQWLKKNRKGAMVGGFGYFILNMSLPVVLTMMNTPGRAISTAINGWGGNMLIIAANFIVWALIGAIIQSLFE